MKLSTILWLLAVVLSDAMCAVVAYYYCDITWGIKYAGYSAPVGVAFLYIIPFAVAIAICVFLALVFKKLNK